jgi:hypothetical protein
MLFVAVSRSTVGKPTRQPDAAGGGGLILATGLASFASRRGAEHMVASLGRGFREEHRKGHATALVVSGNEDGSLKLTQSRVLSASGGVYTRMRTQAQLGSHCSRGALQHE